jgi:hypothetical protein
MSSATSETGAGRPKSLAGAIFIAQKYKNCSTLVLIVFGPGYLDVPTFPNSPDGVLKVIIVQNQSNTIAFMSLLIKTFLLLKS